MTTPGPEPHTWRCPNPYGGCGKNTWIPLEDGSCPSCGAVRGPVWDVIGDTQDSSETRSPSADNYRNAHDAGNIENVDTTHHIKEIDMKLASTSHEVPRERRKDTIVASSFDYLTDHFANRDPAWATTLRDWLRLLPSSGQHSDCQHKQGPRGVFYTAPRVEFVVV